MKTKNILLIIAVIVVIVILFYSFQASQNDPGYASEIKKYRDEREQFMRSSSESPFAKKKDQFKGLKYFNPDPKYRITATFTPVKDRKVVVLPTSDGKEERYIEYGYAEFDLDQFHNKLLILEMIDMGPYRGKLFLAFGDATSGNETYGAGRYLDVNKVPGGATSITLDFNKAYNPYCAYEYSFSCPLPPKENLLNVAIRAGEKTYEEL